MKILNFLVKYLNKDSYEKNKLIDRQLKDKLIYEKKIKNKLYEINNIILNKSTINFLHSGHIGDIINSLPVIKLLSKSHKCNLIIELNKPTPIYYSKHPSGQFFMNKKSYDMLIPLLEKQDYISMIEVYINQKIDIDLNLIRSMPIDLEFDSMKYSFHIVGFQPNLNETFLSTNENHFFKNKIVIQRSLRRQNHLINYSFLKNYPPSYFLGTKDEFNELKKELNNLEFYECKNFLDMANAIKSSKLFIGNSSLGFTIAEGLKSPRLLESFPWSSPQQVHGLNGYDFFFQIHFEKYFKDLYFKK